MSFITFILAYVLSVPAVFFTIGWTALAGWAATKGFAYVWGVAGLGVACIVALGWILQDPLDADWPGVGFLQFALFAYGAFVFIICLLIAAWRRDHSDDFVDQEFSE